MRVILQMTKMLISKTSGWFDRKLRVYQKISKRARLVIISQSRLTLQGSTAPRKLSRKLSSSFLRLRRDEYHKSSVLFVISKGSNKIRVKMSYTKRLIPRCYVEMFSRYCFGGPCGHVTTYLQLHTCVGRALIDCVSMIVDLEEV